MLTSTEVGIKRFLIGANSALKKARKHLLGDIVVLFYLWDIVRHYFVLPPILLKLFGDVIRIYF